MKSEHYYNLIEVFNKLDNNIEKILDAGSGKSSLYALTEYYKTCIDAIVYPGDNRKIDSIKSNINKQYNLIEIDICKNNITKKYDLVLAHLLLGEAMKWNNKFELLLEKLLNINSKYYIIYDFLEDISIDYNYLENYLLHNNFEIV
ncbi:MAG: hypothetical protein Q4G04_03430, partial [bacterium]|nr:hypothetical protein [bacterium]